MASTTSLSALIEERISAALTVEVLTKLALRGISESAAREHLRKCAIAAIAAA